MSVNSYPVDLGAAFFDASGTKIFESMNRVGKDQTLPPIGIGATLEVLDAATGQHYLGTVSTIKSFWQLDGSNLAYSTFIQCINSYRL